MQGVPESVKLLGRSMQFWLITAIWVTPILWLSIWSTSTALSVRALARELAIVGQLRSVAQALNAYASEHDRRLPPAESRFETLETTGYLISEFRMIQVKGREYPIRFTAIDRFEWSLDTPLCYVDPAAFDGQRTIVHYLNDAYYVEAPDLERVLNQLDAPPEHARRAISK